MRYAPMQKFALLIVVVVLMGMMACGPSAQEASGACVQIATAVSKAEARCNVGPEKERYDAYIARVACGDCTNIVSVRDNASIGSCVTEFEAATCTGLKDAENSIYCRNQLVRKSDLTTCP